MITLNGVEVEFNLMDIEVGEKYEKGIQRIVERTKAKSGFEIRKEEFLGMAELCDDLFGRGMGKKIMGEKLDYSVFLEVMASLTKALQDNEKEIVERIQKYSPNRALKRTAK